MIRKKATRPPKPFDGFLLTAHPNGQWCKKIRGKLHYFGPWVDWQGALDLFEEHKDDLYAGRTPRRNGDDPTLADLMNSFPGSKKLLVARKEISSRSFQDYVRTCDKIADSIGTRQLLSDLATEDFQKLRGDLANGHSPTTLKGDLGWGQRVRLRVPWSSSRQRCHAFGENLLGHGQRDCSRPDSAQPGHIRPVQVKGNAARLSDCGHRIAILVFIRPLPLVPVPRRELFLKVGQIEQQHGRMRERTGAVIMSPSVHG